MTRSQEKELSQHERVIRPRQGMVSINFAELWRYRELFWFLAWRDILIRYKQTMLGVAWALLEPALTVLVFTIIFGKFAKFPSKGVPYPVLTLAAVLPWQFFANALSESSSSLVGSARIITKVYFPRLIIPASAVLGGTVNAAISLLLLAGMMIWYHVSFSAHLLMLPAFLMMAFFSAFAVGLWLSALNVRYRDVRYIVPFFTRIGLYVSPVGFVSSIVPEKWRFWYSLNPMVGVIDGFRWSILGSDFEPYWPGFWGSVTVIVVLLLSGLAYFRAAEKSFADVI